MMTRTGFMAGGYQGVAPGPMGSSPSERTFRRMGVSVHLLGNSFPLLDLRVALEHFAAHGRLFSRSAIL
jgi:hypothetical protein